MNEQDEQTFTALFRDACEKCFGHSLNESLSETESKLFYNRIFDATGLVVGWKSLKNYSSFISGKTTGKAENPSVATLDTMARYVLDAPYTTEIERKEKESHFPYWFEYKEKFHRSLPKEGRANKRPGHIQRVWIWGGLVFLVLASAILLINAGLHEHARDSPFTEDFHQVSGSSLSDRGWFVQSADTIFWNKRSETENQLTLYTLKGDNWPNVHEKISVRNLLLRNISTDCFEAEVHFTDFFPKENWQQAGILLLEDTSFTGKSLRLSVAYNDFFGGYSKPREIIVQAITSMGKNYGEPEEIAHQTVLIMDSVTRNPSLIQNIKNISLKIEKEGSRFRILFAGSGVENPAFKEVTTHAFDMHPRYIGLFALKGFVDSASIIPARFTFFRLKQNGCP